MSQEGIFSGMLINRYSLIVANNLASLLFRKWVPLMVSELVPALASARQTEPSAVVLF